MSAGAPDARGRKRRFTGRALGAALALTAPLALPWAQETTRTATRPATPAQIREHLRELDRQRADAAWADRVIPLETAVLDRDPGVARAWAALRLVHDMRALAAVWTFEPLDAGAGEPVRVPLPVFGQSREQIVVLPAGRWRASLQVGTPDGEWELRLSPREWTLARGSCHRLALTREVERELQARFRTVAP